jgi:hypothetical protein
MITINILCYLQSLINNIDYLKYIKFNKNNIHFFLIIIF